MSGLVHSTTSFNWVSIFLAGVMLYSFVQGLRRGGFGSAKQLFSLAAELLSIILSALAAWQLAKYLSPFMQSWMMGKELEIPNYDLSFWQQLYYTSFSAIRDFDMIRSAVLFLIGYFILKGMLGWFYTWFIHHNLETTDFAGSRRGAASGLFGAVIGFVIGIVRSLLIIAVLFVYVTFLPQAPYMSQIEASKIYKVGADQVIEPWFGDLVRRFPVFTQTVGEEFDLILQRRYEVIDHPIPEDIKEAALVLTEGLQTDEEKAKKLYEWVGTRIQYDWDKFRLYEEERIWKEQSPQDTYDLKSGVCIDYSRLYAVMARAAGLDVRVVTGLGADGRGGYGSHAWNEVYLSETDEWVPLDTTWVSSGGNWFNPPNFYDTHMKDA